MSSQNISMRQTEVRLHSPLHSLPDVISSRLLTITFTTAAFDRSSLWRFEAFPYRTAPKGPPSSLVQHDAFASSWHNLWLVPPLPRNCQAFRLPAVPRVSLRFLRFAVPPRRLGLRSRRREAQSPRAGGCLPDFPTPVHRRRRQDPPGSWRTTLRTCRALRPRRDLCARPLMRFHTISTAQAPT